MTTFHVKQKTTSVIRVVEIQKEFDIWNEMTESLFFNFEVFFPVYITFILSFSTCIMRIACILYLNNIHVYIFSQKHL